MSIWSIKIVVSGAMIRSADRWEISRSCQSYVFISYHVTTDNTLDLSCFSEPIGLRLWGHCWRPFWPLAKEPSLTLFRFWRPRISVAIRSIEVAMLARTAKYSAWRSRAPVWDFLSTDTKLVADVFSTNGGMSAKLPTTRNLTNFHTSGRMLETLDVPFSFRCTKLPISDRMLWNACTPRGVTHHDEWICAP